MFQRKFQKDFVMKFLFPLCGVLKFERDYLYQRIWKSIGFKDKHLKSNGNLVNKNKRSENVSKESHTKNLQISGHHMK